MTVVTMKSETIKGLHTVMPPVEFDDPCIWTGEDSYALEVHALDRTATVIVPNNFTHWGKMWLKWLWK
jgi:hypothetical protein